MGYGLSRTVVLFSTGPLLKKLWPLEVDLLASLILWSTFGFVCCIFAVVGFVLSLKCIFHKNHGQTDRRTNGRMDNGFKGVRFLVYSCDFM